MARATGRRYATFDVVGAGPRVVAGICEEHGDTVLYPYEKVYPKFDHLERYDIIMISAMSTDTIAVEKLVSTIRRAGFKGVIVIGGPISFKYTDILLRLDVDYVVVGEGEIPLEILLRELSKGVFKPDHVPALAYRDVDGSVRLTSGPVHTDIIKLDSIKPWTRVQESFDKPWIYRFYVEVVRGCSNFHRPMINLVKTSCIQCLKCHSPRLSDRLICPAGIPPGCGFCSVPFLFGPPRSRGVKSIVHEIEELVANGARRIVLSAPDFLDYGRERLVEGPLTDPCSPPPNLDAIEELLGAIFSIDEIKSRKAVVMIENIKACLVNEEVGKLLGRYLKDTTVHIGLETGCDWFNERILGKPIYLEHVVTASNILRRNGIKSYVYLMYGLPFANDEVYKSTLDSLSKLAQAGVEKITLYKYLNLPGTAFEDLEPTASNSKLITEIKKTIEKYNLAMKRSLIGKLIEAWAIETKRGVYAYPVTHGPVIRIIYKGRQRIDGCRVLVRVIDISPRLVIAKLINVLECPGVNQHPQRGSKR